MRQIIMLLILAVSLMAGIGQVTAVKGEAYLKRGSATSVVTKGMELERHDSIETLDLARVQILFNDETVITLGKKTRFSIEEYLFDDGKAAADFSVPRGFFKSMTGKIGKVAPEKFKVKLRTATIGVRGTHFMGRIDEEKEIIGCTGGAISVTAQGVSVEVLAGEMVSIVAGMVPPAPVPLNMKKIQESSDTPEVSEIKGKIAALQLEEGETTFDKEAIMAVLDDIAQIEESDTRRALEDQLNLHLNTLFNEGLTENFVKTDMSSATTSYTPLTWGVFTLKDLDGQGDLYGQVSRAVPLQTYYELEGGGVPTPVSTTVVSGLMGSTDGTTIPAHWDGSAGSHTLMSFEGSVLAVSGLTQLSSESDLNLFSVTDPDATNSAVFTIDFASRRWTGDVTFQIKNNKTGELETIRMVNVSMGENAVNPTGFHDYGIIYDVNGHVDTSVQEEGEGIYALYYYGDSAVNQIGGEFNFYREDGSLINGSIILDATATTTLTAQSAGTMETIFDWGYWAETTIGADPLTSNPHGAWINPQEAVADISSLLGTTATASYSGTVHGTVHSFDGTTALMENGTISMDFDFSSQTMDGGIAFQAGSEQWDTTITGAPVTATGFSFDQTNITNGTGADQAVIMTEGSGKFYGENAEYAGGGFEMMSSAGKTAIGAFGATKQ